MSFYSCPLARVLNLGKFEKDLKRRPRELKPSTGRMKITDVKTTKARKEE
jgi:translation initiation factor IF-3